MLYSMHGLKTLLIDADVFHSVLTERLRPHPDGSDGHPLAGETSKHIRRAAEGWFDFIPSTVSTAKDLLSIKNMQGLLPDLQCYEMIVVDLPPLTAGSEKLAVSSLFDGVILTAGWGRTPTEALGELVRTLHAVKAPLIGVLLTKVRMMSARPSTRHTRQHPC